MQRYCPVGAVAAEGADVNLHRNHWLAEFVFSKPSKEGLEYDVHILLDGQEVGYAVRPWRGHTIERAFRKPARR